MVSSNATLGDQLVSWDSPEGHALLKLLPPSTNVINFRIAHEIAHLKNQDIVWSIAVSPVFLVAGYHLAVFLCKSEYFELVNKSLWNNFLSLTRSFLCQHSISLPSPLLHDNICVCRDQCCHQLSASGLLCMSSMYIPACRSLAGVSSRQGSSIV